MRARQLQGPIAPAVPFPKVVTDGFTPIGNPALDFTSAEIGGYLTPTSPIHQIGLSMSLPPDLTLRRFYIYMFISADSGKAVQMTPSLDLSFQGQSVGKLPIQFSNVTGFSVFSVLQRSTISFAGGDLNAAGGQLSNCIELNVLGAIPLGASPNYTPGESQSVLISPYEMTIRCDRAEVKPWQPTDTSYNGRLFVGVLSMNP